ncbi:MAG TPA: amidohydrolase [Acidothermaceae bacterium]
MVTGGDIALVNGRIWPHRPGDGVTAVRVRQGVIAAVGSDGHALADRTSKTAVVDLRGRIVLPGFVDSHTHFHRFAVLRRHFLDLDDPSITRIQDVVDAVAGRVADRPAGSWIEGDNLADGRLQERRLPTRHDLDRVSAQHPVLLRGVGKHLAVANSLALRLAGIDRATPDPAGGRIERDEDGEPTGVLHERGKLRLDTTRVDTVVPPLDESERLKALSDGLRGLHQRGVTSIHEITRTRTEFSDYKCLREVDDLSVRVVSYVRVIEAQATLDALTSVGFRSGYGDDWLRLGGVKVSIDGSCTFKNAAMYEPYPGDPGNTGIVRIEQAELDDVVRAADAAGLAVAVHAIGPRAVDMALDAFAKAARRNGPSSLRHRVEHAYVTPGRDRLARMRQLGLLLSTQPSFIWSVGDIWSGIFGAESAGGMVPLRTAIDVGLTVLANSDCPTAPVDPLLAVASAVTRKTRGGQVLGGDETVTVAQAVDMQTTAPAFAIHQEDRVGRVAEGMLGDLVVLGADPRDTEPGEVPAIPVHATVVGGRVVFEKELG